MAKLYKVVVQGEYRKAVQGSKDKEAAAYQIEVSVPVVQLDVIRREVMRELPKQVPMYTSLRTAAIVSVDGKYYDGQGSLASLQPVRYNERAIEGSAAEEDEAPKAKKEKGKGKAKKSEPTEDQLDDEELPPLEDVVDGDAAEPDEQ